MATKKLIPAPLDDKNVTTDWIEELFDDQSALYSKDKLFGFMAGAAMQASWSSNELHWKVLDGDRYAAIKCLRGRNRERYPESESPFIIKEQILANVCIWRFYWKNET